MKPACDSERPPRLRASGHARVGDWTRCTSLFCPRPGCGCFQGKEPDPPQGQTCADRASELRTPRTVVAGRVRCIAWFSALAHPIGSDDRHRLAPEAPLKNLAVRAESVWAVAA